jgi:hypothetical protein
MAFKPYMPSSQYDDVLGHVMFMAEKDPSSVYFRLKRMLLEIDAAGKKKSAKIGMARKQSKARNIGGKIGTFLLNYNTVESILLVSGVLVCLLALMYQVIRDSDPGYNATRDSITAWLMLVLLGSITFFFLVFIMDISVQYLARKNATAKSSDKAAAKRSAAPASPGADRSASSKALFSYRHSGFGLKSEFEATPLELNSAKKKRKSGIEILKDDIATEAGVGTNPLFFNNAQLKPKVAAPAATPELKKGPPHAGPTTPHSAVAEPVAGTTPTAAVVRPAVSAVSNAMALSRANMMLATIKGAQARSRAAAPGSMVVVQGANPLLQAVKPAAAAAADKAI